MIIMRITPLFHNMFARVVSLCWVVPKQNLGGYTIGCFGPYALDVVLNIVVVMARSSHLRVEMLVAVVEQKGGQFPALSEMWRSTMHMCWFFALRNALRLNDVLLGQRMRMLERTH